MTHSSDGKNHPALNLAELFAAGPFSLRQALIEASADAAPLALDGGAIEAAEFGAIQVLCAAFRDAEQARRTITWTAASPVLRTLASRLGVATLLHLDVEAPALG